MVMGNGHTRNNIVNWGHSNSAIEEGVMIMADYETLSAGRGFPITPSEIEHRRGMYEVGDYFILRNGKDSKEKHFVGKVITKSEHFLTVQSLLNHNLKRTLTYVDLILSRGGAIKMVSEEEAMDAVELIKRRHEIDEE